MDGMRADKNACLSAYLSRRFPQGYVSLYFAFDVRETDHSFKKNCRGIQYSIFKKGSIQDIFGSQE